MQEPSALPLSLHPLLLDLMSYKHGLQVYSTSAGLIFSIVDRPRQCLEKDRYENMVSFTKLIQGVGERKKKRKSRLKGQGKAHVRVLTSATAASACDTGSYSTEFEIITIVSN